MNATNNPPRPQDSATNADDFFFLCYFETTRRCKQRCAGCMTRRPATAQAEELTSREARELVIDEVAALAPKAAIAFSGGEHLLRADAFDLIAHAARRGLWSLVATSGHSLVDTDAVHRAAAAAQGKIIFMLPFNSVDGTAYAPTRDDGPDTALRAAQRCREEDVPFMFTLTVSKSNLAALPATVAFLGEQNVPVHCSPFVPRAAGRPFRKLMIDACEMERIVHPAVIGNPLAYLSLTPFFGAPERVDQALHRHALRIDGIGCQAARGLVAVGPEGQVAPCAHLLDSSCVCGNVRYERLSDIVRTSPVFVALRRRTHLGGKCGRCRYQQTCGGCRALAFHYSGDIEAEDPTCFFTPENMQSRCPLEDEQTRRMEQLLEYVNTTEPWRRFLGRADEPTSPERTTKGLTA